MIPVSSSIPPDPLVALEIPFRVTDLKQWVYCPRILYYHFCLPDIRPTTFKMQVGIEAGQSEVGREVRRSLAPYNLQEGVRTFNFALASPKLGLRGEVDLVIWLEDQREVIPVDYKNTTRSGTHFKLQLAAYGMMLEECCGWRTSRGFLYYIPLRKADEVRLTKRLRNKLLAALHTMHHTHRSEFMPRPTPHRQKCANCEFRRFCNDVL